MYRQDVFNRLDFDNNGILHHDIGAISTWQADTLVNQRHRYLTRESQAVLLKFPAQAFLIHFFQQTRTKLSMNFYCQSDDTIGAILRNRTIFFFVGLEIFVSLANHIWFVPYKALHEEPSITPYSYQTVNQSRPLPAFFP